MSEREKTLTEYSRSRGCAFGLTVLSKNSFALLNRVCGQTLASGAERRVASKDLTWSDAVDFVIGNGHL